MARMSARIIKAALELKEAILAERREAEDRVLLRRRLDKYTCKKLGGHPVGENIPGIVRRQYHGGAIDYDAPYGGW